MDPSGIESFEDSEDDQDDYDWDDDFDGTEEDVEYYHDYCDNDYDDYL